MLFASRSRSRSSAQKLAVCCLFALSLASWAQAASTIVDTGGFEGFSLANLEGQSGWLNAGGGGGTAMIQGAVVESGAQALRVDRGENSNDRWAVPVGDQGHPTNRYVLVDWDMNVTASGAPSGVFGPFLGVDTYNDINGPKVLGSLGVDATTGDVLYQLGGSGVLAETSASVSLGTWNHFQIQLDFLQDTYTVLLNSTLLVSTPFVDGAADTFTDADIAAFAASFDSGSQGQVATAYFDNFLVRNVDRADFEVNGDVAGEDLLIWESAYGVSASGDADQDLDTDGNDFLIWQREFQGGTGPLSGPISAVPEPSTLALALLVLGLRTRRLSRTNIEDKKGSTLA